MLVPIKPVKCGCGSEKFKDWCTGKGPYEVTPISSLTLSYLVNATLDDTPNASGEYLKVRVDGSDIHGGEVINDVDCEQINLIFMNSTLSNATFRFYIYYADGRIIESLNLTIAPSDAQIKNIRISKEDKITGYTVVAGEYARFYYDNRNREDFKLSDVIESDLITSTEDEFFNTYYANWCIVDPFDDFESELKVAFMLAEDKLTTYKAQLTDFNPGAHTVMSVDYGERGNTEYGYRYPIGGNVNTSAPNTGAKATVDAVTDTTTVDKNEEPFKNLDKTKAMDGWLKFFVDQFKDCFTLCEAMTW